MIGFEVIRNGTPLQGNSAAELELAHFPLLGTHLEKPVPVDRFLDQCFSIHQWRHYVLLHVEVCLCLCSGNLADCLDRPLITAALRPTNSFVGQSGVLYPPTAEQCASQRLRPRRAISLSTTRRLLSSTPVRRCMDGFTIHCYAYFLYGWFRLFRFRCGPGTLI